MVGGHPPAAYITDNFDRIDKKDNKSNRYYFQCKHCGLQSEKIENRDNLLALHLIDVKKCSKAPNDARAQARTFLLGKGVETGPPILTPGDVDDAANSTAKSQPGIVVAKKRKLGPLDGFVDQAMTDEQIEQANLKLLRYVLCSFHFHQHCVISICQIHCVWKYCLHGS